MHDLQRQRVFQRIVLFRIIVSLLLAVVEMMHRAEIFAVDGNDDVSIILDVELLLKIDDVFRFQFASKTFRGPLGTSRLSRSQERRMLLMMIKSHLQSFHQRQDQSQVLHHQLAEIVREISMNQLDFLAAAVPFVISGDKGHQPVFQQQVAMFAGGDVAMADGQQFGDASGLAADEMKQQHQLDPEQADPVQVTLHPRDGDANLGVRGEQSPSQHRGVSNQLSQPGVTVDVDGPRGSIILQERPARIVVGGVVPQHLQVQCWERKVNDVPEQQVLMKDLLGLKDQVVNPRAEFRHEKLDVLMQNHVADSLHVAESSAVLADLHPVRAKIQNSLHRTVEFSDHKSIHEFFDQNGE